MWRMPTEVPLFITAKWAITTDMAQFTHRFKPMVENLMKPPIHNLIQQLN